MRPVNINQSIDVEIATPMILNFAMNILLIGKIIRLAAIVETSKKFILLVALWNIVAVEYRIKNNEVNPKSKNISLCDT
jgi:hypothetical protein